MGKIFVLGWNSIFFLRTCTVIFFVFLTIFVISFFLFLKCNRFSAYRRRLMKFVFYYKNASYSNLCLEIYKILSDNKKLFENFSVISNFNSTYNPFERDLSLWNKVKKTEIVPNNKKILDLIFDNYELIPESQKDVFDKFRLHAVAFEAHVYDCSVDYNRFQFPKEFEKTIQLQIIKNNYEERNKISNWIKEEVNHIESLSSSNIWIFGSIFKKNYEDVNDIDIVIFSSLLTKDVLSSNNYSSSIKNLKELFEKKFKKSIHLTVFGSSEKFAFESFLSNIDVKVEL